MSEIDKEARMHADTIVEAENFLGRWRRSQRLLIKEGFAPRDPVVEEAKFRQNCRNCDPSFVADQLNHIYMEHGARVHDFAMQRLGPTAYLFCGNFGYLDTIPRLLAGLEEWISAHTAHPGM